MRQAIAIPRLREDELVEPLQADAPLSAIGGHPLPWSIRGGGQRLFESSRSLVLPPCL
jgi:hypothetical protein